MTDPHRTNVGVAFGTLLATTGTLMCCVMPAVLVSIGAGATVVGLVSTFPQLVWLSERKGLVFGVAATMLALAGLMIWRARRMPCPVDPAAARNCERLRRVAGITYLVALASFGAGILVSFILPFVGSLTGS